MSVYPGNVDKGTKEKKKTQTENFYLMGYFLAE